jgi:serine/threonine protein kinase
MSSSEVTTVSVIADQYEVVRPLGQGSFGHTYLARDRAKDRLVAIKVLDPRTVPDWKAVERFEREANVLRSLRHHGIPEVHDLLQSQWQGTDASFLVMEYVEGVSLAQVIDERRTLDSGEVLGIFIELLGILEYLHARIPPVLHRDIKPANIIVRPNGLPALVDFGSVRRVFLGPDETGSTVAGTYGYMPYEQYMGQATPASDLYSLGATFLHLVTGRAPREFMNAEGRIDVPEHLPGDSRLRPVIMRLLEPSPAQRFQNARDVRQSLLSASQPAIAISRAPRAAIATIVDPFFLEPGPRPMNRECKKLLKDFAPTTLELMDGSAKPTEEPGLFEYASLVFFSVLTAGILPITFFGLARARKRRLRRFLRDGYPTLAEILSIQVEKAPFDSTISRVAYQFEADGALRRDTDQVLPVIAGRWQPGDRVPALYLPEFNYDSVLIGR